MLQRGPEIPGTLLAALTAFQDGHILRPAQRPQFWIVGIGAVELPHPPQVSRGEAPGLRIVLLEILSGHHRRALLRAGADGPADCKVQLHLRELRPHELIQYPIHGAVIGWLSDVHWALLSGTPHLISPDHHGD